MKLLPIIILATTMLSGVCVSIALADQTYMSLTFDDKTIDAPLGQGGTAIGEATWYHDSLQAIVRATPFDTPSLELHCQEGACPIEFDVPGSPISSGLAVIIMDFWFQQVGAGWGAYFEIYSQSWQVLLLVSIRGDGTITINDSELAATVPNYPTGRPLPIMITMDMDSDTYSVWVDQVQWVTDRPLALPDKEFYTMTIQPGSSGNADTRFAIDQIRVIDWIPEVPIRETTWGRIKSSFR